MGMRERKREARKVEWVSFSGTEKTGMVTTNNEDRRQNKEKMRVN